MIKIEKLKVYGLEEAIRGMRNPKNSWDKSDSYYTHIEDVENPTELINSEFHVGDADKELMMKLAKGGPVHAKYRRYIDVHVDITAPLYFWKEFDTYRVGVCPNPSDIEMNSCSTMHKIHEKEFTMEDFSHDHLINMMEEPIPYSENAVYAINAVEMLEETIDDLNCLRRNYLNTKDKKYWWQMIQLLPSSYNQKRTVKLNYEVLANMYEFRHSHKLDEWVELMKFFKENCPYSEIFTTDFKKQEREEIRKTEIKNFHDFICENLFNNIDAMIANDDLEKIQYTMLQLIISNKIDSLTDEYLNKEKKGVKE